MRRIIEPEKLDVLPAEEPLAVGSRGDLRRLNLIMGHAGILSRALREHLPEITLRSRPVRLAELGSGDGTLLLRLARRLPMAGATIEAILLDRQQIVSRETRRGFGERGWFVESATTDVFSWLEKPTPAVDVMLANLFLHHFSDRSLAELFKLAAARTNVFIACEPRRSALALAASQSLRFLGCNEITRHDAVVSVRAGFTGCELSATWPTDGRWRLSERRAGLFSHGFIAKRNG